MAESQEFPSVDNPAQIFQLFKTGFGARSSFLEAGLIWDEKL